MQFYTTTSVYPILCEHITLSCLNTRKTIKFYVVCATCQNACACLCSLSKGWFWNTRFKSLPGSAASCRVSSAGLWKETKLPVSFHTRLPPCRFLREFSTARSLQRGQDTAAHRDSPACIQEQAKSGRAGPHSSDCRTLWELLKLRPRILSGWPGLGPMNLVFQL